MEEGAPLVHSVQIVNADPIISESEELCNASVDVDDAHKSTVRSVNKRAEPKSVLTSKTGSEKSRVGRSAHSTNAAPVTATTRRNSTGGSGSGLGSSKRQQLGPGERKPSVPSVSEPSRRSLPETRTSKLPDVSKSVREVKKLGSVSPAATTLKTPTSTSYSKIDPVSKPRFTRTTGSSTKMVDSSSSAGSTIKKLVSKNLTSSARSPAVTTTNELKKSNKFSSPSARSPSVNSGFKKGATSASRDRNSSLSGEKKVTTPESQDSRFIVLPQVEMKAGDDLRLDMRGQRIRNLNASGLKLTQNLEFVYLRDNLLSSLEGIEILKRVKVLDLSFNDFKGPGFEPLQNCQVLQQLYLAGNQITSLSSLPELPNLEFLSVAQNKLKSLCMASQPRLQVLAASKNKLSSLKGFPHLPVLEHLRIEENPILRMPHLEAASILLVGPTLKKFNDRDLSKEEMAIAKHYPAHTALCIKDGWEFCSPDRATDSTFDFLMEHWKEQLPPGFQLKEASIDLPFEEDACRCHFIFLQNHGNDLHLVLKYQWYVGEGVLSTFKAISGAISEVYSPKHDDVNKYLKVECIPVLGEIEYPPIFAISSLVSPGTGCPKVLNLDVRGDLVEGNVIRGCAEVAWCGGTPGKGVSSWLRRKWNSIPVVISGAEDDEYQLTMDDVDSSLVFMYTPVTSEGTKGEPQYAITDYVKAAPPSVSNLRIIGDFVEGNTIKGSGDYFGGREGPSKYVWLRENNDTGVLELVLNGAADYTLTREDVGSRVVFTYIPVNFEGKEGESASVFSDMIRQAPPKVTNTRIIGELREGSKITVSGTVTGGTEGASRVQWFKSSSLTLFGEDGLEALSMSKIAKAFRIPLGAVGSYIVAKFTPMTPDGEAGEPAYVVSEKTVETLPPSLNFLSVTGDYAEGEMLTASYGYIGGHEGRSMYNWYLHEDQNDSGTSISEVSGRLQYQIPKEAIGKFISFRCIPVRDDGMIGQPRICMGQERVRAGNPRLVSLQIAGKSVEGSMLVAEKLYWGGEEGESVFRWFRGDSSGQKLEISDAITASYTLSVDDVGCFISVSCEPVRSDWARGPVVLSEQLGPIVPGPPLCEALKFSGSMMEGERLTFIASYSGGVKGDCCSEWFRVQNNGHKEKLCANDFLDLTLEDVASRIEVTFTPVRNDGARGNPQSTVSDIIMPADPVGLELVIPDCHEADMVLPRKRYFGGHEGDGEYIWYRTKNMLHGPDLSGISDADENITVCGRNLTYTPCLDDVGSYLVLYWLPIRKDGKPGKPLVSICDDPVAPAYPVVKYLHVKALNLSTYVGEGEYFGGHEGSSLFSWYRVTVDGTMTLINGADSQTYIVTESDYNCRLLFGYTPVRSDLVVGEMKLSDPTEIILPDLLQIEMVALTGKAMEGEMLTAVEVIPNSESQQDIWGKYKKYVKYIWYHSDSGDVWEIFSSENSCSYKLRFDDIDRYLRCECIVTDVFGRSSEPVHTEIIHILPGIPRISKLEIEGRGFHTNLYAVRGIYSGGKEGKSRIQWLRSMVGSPDLISIPGEIGRMYEANVDDVGYRLVAVYTPVREDGVEGNPVSTSTEPIAVEPDVLEEVKKKLDLGSVKFEVICNKAPSSKKVLDTGGLERRILEINKKRVKVVKPGSKTSFPTTEMRGSYAPPFHVEVFRNDQHRLRIVVDSENEVDIMVHTRHLRDVIVLVLRGIAQKFNSTSLNSLLKIEA
ncbi:187-kDa microtubule-associated protein AIR9 [Amaranthus tricolor]|uniref:187-kDa microtubule-associated protein AIR9 n=1 Tax=Amaranthus tricolor TaxID=29722 RepID=UPI0025898537|nr:187-kDa microtubule-associated protein AIR9 [Amaranthus tricolor]